MLILTGLNTFIHRLSTTVLASDLLFLLHRKDSPCVARQGTGKFFSKIFLTTSFISQQYTYEYYIDKQGWNNDKQGLYNIAGRRA